MRNWTTAVEAKTSPVEIFRALLLEEAKAQNGTVHASNVRGYNLTGVVKDIIERQPDARCIMSFFDSKSEITQIYLVGDNSGFFQVIYTDNHVEFSMQSLDKDRVLGLSTAVKDGLSEAPVRGTVHMLAFEQSYYLTELGEVDHPLERQNYTPGTLEKYDRVLEDLISASPTGRLTILDGEPGTGKSFLIRGIISSASALFIYVPASVAGRITGPDIIPIIMQEKDKDVPIVLLMEDADSSLTTRQMDNVSKLSDLLNMSDGILGDMSDLRIIATTNSKKSEIDRAVMRHGRMNEHIELGLLEPIHAYNVFARLVGPDAALDSHHTFATKITLADVYREARRYGWKPAPAIRKRRRNFSIPPPEDYNY